MLAATFLDFNIGQVVIVLGMLGGFILWFSRFEGRVRSISQSVTTLTTEVTRTLAELAIRINAIDREGTRKSQQSIASDEKLNEITLKRIDKLEDIAAVLVPDVAKISINMQWIVHHVQKNGATLAAKTAP